MNVPTKDAIPRIVLLRGVLVSWIAGLCLAHVPGFSLWWSILIVGGIALCLVPMRKTIPWKILGFFALAFFSATTRFVLTIPSPIIDPATIESHIGKTLEITGTVTQTSTTDETSSRFILETNPPYRGKIYVFSRQPLTVHYGEIVSVSGKIQRPLDFTPEFSWRAYLQSRGIGAILSDPRIQSTGQYGRNRFLRSFDALRQRITREIAILLPHRSAALLSGILMGSKASFSQNFLDDLQTTGLTHIVALSGFNITILIAFVTGLLLHGVGRYARFTLALLVVIAFILLVGPSASVIRAAVMGIITLLALTMGRRADPLNMLLLALVIMTAYQPSWLFTDLGFQLSFLATLGIVLFIPLSHSRLPKNKSIAVIVEGLSTTLAAQLTTLPFLLLSFGTVSLISPLTNLLVVSTIPAIMLLGSLAIVVKLIPGLGFLAQGLGFLSYLPLAYVEKTISFFAHLPLASLDITWWNGYWTTVSYALIAMLYRFMRKKQETLIA